MSTEYRCDVCGMPIDERHQARYVITGIACKAIAHDPDDDTMTDSLDLCADCAGHAKLLIQDDNGVESVDLVAVRSMILAALQVEANRTVQAAAPNLAAVLRQILDIAGDPDIQDLRKIVRLAQDALRNPHMASA